jgi:molybdate transport repressor ModE-like protein
VKRSDSRVSGPQAVKPILPAMKAEAHRKLNSVPAAARAQGEGPVWRSREGADRKEVSMADTLELGPTFSKLIFIDSSLMIRMMNPRHLDLDLLRTLVAIADSGSFSTAAERLGRSQSAVSLQVKRLEEQVGQPLLDRAQGRLNGPTEEGRALLDYARRLLRLHDEACSLFTAPACPASCGWACPRS